jgi:hypothetical protein
MSAYHSRIDSDSISFYISAILDSYLSASEICCLKYNTNHDLLYRYKVYIAKKPRNYQYLLCMCITYTHHHMYTPGIPCIGPPRISKTSKTSRLCKALRHMLHPHLSIFPVATSCNRYNIVIITKGLRLIAVAVCTRLVTRI